MKQVALIGFGPGSEGMLTCAAREKLTQAHLVIGASRLLDMLPNGSTDRRIAAVRDEEIAAILRDEGSWQKACVVLSGDVGIFSGAKRLRDHLGAYEVATIPGISSVQYFAALLQRPWQDWQFASAHGVACDVVSLLDAEHPLFLVTGGEHTVTSLCEALCEAGHAHAHIAVGERLSYANERVVEGRAADFCTSTFDALSVMLIEKEGSPDAICVKAGGAGAASAGVMAEANVDASADLISWPWATPGIPDDWFVRGAVPMTKQEVRVVALAKLRIAPGDTVYDVGAGTGSVSVEAALLARDGHVCSIEHKSEAVELIRQNCARFGVSNVTVREGSAPAALAGLPVPDAVFVGGSGRALPSILSHVYELNSQVRVCIACVTLETLSQTLSLLSNAQFTQFEATQVAVSRAEVAGAYHMMRAQNPVFVISARGAGHDA